MLFTLLLPEEDEAGLALLLDDDDIDNDTRIFDEKKIKIKIYKINPTNLMQLEFDKFLVLV